MANHHLAQDGSVHPGHSRTRCPLCGKRAREKRAGRSGTAWRKRRLAVLNRDGWICADCRPSPTPSTCHPIGEPTTSPPPTPRSFRSADVATADATGHGPHADPLRGPARCLSGGGCANPVPNAHRTLRARNGKAVASGQVERGVPAQAWSPVKSVCESTKQIGFSKVSRA